MAGVALGVQSPRHLMPSGSGVLVDAESRANAHGGLETGRRKEKKWIASFGKSRSKRKITTGKRNHLQFEIHRGQINIHHSHSSYMMINDGSNSHRVDVEGLLRGGDLDLSRDQRMKVMYRKWEIMKVRG